jgi:hypothetical protein
MRAWEGCVHGNDACMGTPLGMCRRLRIAGTVSWLCRPGRPSLLRSCTPAPFAGPHYSQRKGNVSCSEIGEHAPSPGQDMYIILDRSVAIRAMGDLPRLALPLSNRADIVCPCRLRVSLCILRSLGGLSACSMSSINTCFLASSHISFVIGWASPTFLQCGTIRMEN